MLSSSSSSPSSPSSSCLPDPDPAQAECARTSRAVGPCPHGAPSLGRESPAEVCAEGEGERVREAQVREGRRNQSRAWGLHGVLGKDREVCLHCLSEAGRPVGGPKSAEQSDTSGRQSLASLRSSLPRDNPGRRGLVPPTGSLWPQPVGEAVSKPRLLGHLHGRSGTAHNGVHCVYTCFIGGPSPTSPFVP